MDVLHTAIEVSDLDATRAFYEDLLGLDRSRQYEIDGVTNYYVTGAGPGELQFRVVDGAPIRRASNTSPSPPTTWTRRSTTPPSVACPFNRSLERWSA